MDGVLSTVTLCEVVVHQRHVIGLYNTVWDWAVQSTLSPLSPEITERHKETCSDVMKYQNYLSSQRLENNGMIFDIWVGYFSFELLWKWQWVYNICFHRTFWEDAVFFCPPKYYILALSSGCTLLFSSWFSHTGLEHLPFPDSWQETYHNGEKCHPTQTCHGWSVWHVFINSTKEDCRPLHH